MWTAMVNTTTEGDDMSYTSSEVKNRWNAQHYKAVTFLLPKDIGEQFAELTKASGTSYRAIFIEIIEEFLGENNGKE